jgi:LPXTG-motif cell wall-anchored protein
MTMYGTENGVSYAVLASNGGTGAVLASTGLSTGAGILTAVGILCVGVALVTAARILRRKDAPRP